MHGSVDAFLSSKIDRAISQVGESDPELARHFHENVLTILSDQCFRCHGEKEKGDLRLDRRDAALNAIAPGDPDNSELISRIVTHDEDERMPPKGEGLAAEQIAVLRDWVAAGADWPPPPLPKYLSLEVPSVPDAAFLRRVYLDTVGVPPSEQEARDFLSNTDSDKRATLVDTMLADQRFADHWVSYWQDVLAENPNMLKPSLNNYRAVQMVSSRGIGGQRATGSHGDRTLDVTRQ